MKVFKKLVFVSSFVVSLGVFAQEKTNNISPVSLKDNWYIILFALFLLVPCFIAMQNQMKKNRELIEDRKNKKLDREDEESYYKNK